MPADMKRYEIIIEATTLYRTEMGAKTPEQAKDIVATFLGAVGMNHLGNIVLLEFETCRVSEVNLMKEEGSQS